jgi:hypothetical protein
MRSGLLEGNAILDLHPGRDTPDPRNEFVRAEDADAWFRNSLRTVWRLIS